MEINIRNGKTEDYESVSKIMNQVQGLHVEWRPDIYKINSNFFPIDYFEEAIKSAVLQKNLSIWN